jgi:hypothetical protein
MVAYVCGDVWVGCCLKACGCFSQMSGFLVALKKKKLKIFGAGMNCVWPFDKYFTPYKRVVVSDKSDKMYILPFTTFVAFWGVSLLCCFLTT